MWNRQGAHKSHRISSSLCSHDNALLYFYWYLYFMLIWPWCILCYVWGEAIKLFWILNLEFIGGTDTLLGICYPVPFTVAQIWFGSFQQKGDIHCNGGADKLWLYHIGINFPHLFSQNREAINWYWVLQYYQNISLAILKQRDAILTEEIFRNIMTKQYKFVISLGIWIEIHQ